MQTVVMEATLPLGGSPPLHVHNDLDDTMYILDGELLVHCGDREQVVGAGHWVSMPRGIPHTFLVTGDRDARVLLVHDNDSFRELRARRQRAGRGARTAAEPAVPADGRARADRGIARHDDRRPAAAAR